MILDDLDLKILKEFSNLDDECTTWDMMKKVLREGKDKEHMLIKRRIERMAKFNLFKINGEKIKTYIMDSNKVFYKEFNFPCGKKKGIAVLFEKKWLIFQAD